MAIEKIKIEQFLSLSKDHPVFDVRSPAEFSHAHIPGSHNLPLFDDEQRKTVGTAYKQQGRQQALKIGLDYFGTKMRKTVEETEEILNNNFQFPAMPVGRQVSNYSSDHSCVLIHCWRGGMRSAALAWLLDMYGYKVYTLAGGYKAFRNWVLRQFINPYTFKVLGGYTGSGKTILIKELKRLGYPVIDLENLANHKGSAFGAEGEKPQPSQEMFENLIAINLFQQKVESQIGKDRERLETLDLDFFSPAIWLEDESQRIGTLNIPKNIWDQMRNSSIYFIDIPFEERLNYLVETYGTIEKENLVNAIIRIEKRLGGLDTKNAVNYILQNKIRESFSILLKYYDKYYDKGLHNRKNLANLLNKIPCSTVSTSNVNTHSLLQTTLK
ncbi:MAG: tRNA 2-selenouridine(34) synthase MnmH [Ginsengibacter sp.]